MTDLSVLLRAFLLSTFVLAACPSATPPPPLERSRSSAPPPARTDAKSSRDSTTDPALVLGEFPLAAKNPVLDGDTIKVEGLDASLRLLAIDTEETFHKQSERDAFEKGWDSYLVEMRGDSKRPVKMATPAGMEAWDYAKEFFKDVPTVRLEHDHPEEVRGFYNRYLVYVFAKKNGEWVNYNVEAVRDGWSPYFTKYGRSIRFHEEFVAAEREARAAKRGIWSDKPEHHYPDYDERLAWWGEREKITTAFALEAQDRDDYVVLTHQNSFDRIRSRVGKEITVLALVGDIKEPAREKAPWLVLLSKNRFSAISLVFFDKAVLDASGLADQKGEYVVVTGTASEYGDYLQIVVNDPEQVKTFVKTP